jgi:hypothetical protein
MAVNNELTRIWKEEVMASRSGLTRYLLGKTEENYEIIMTRNVPAKIRIGHPLL